MYLFGLEFCLDICLGVGLLDHMVVLFLVFWGTPIPVLHSGCTNSHSHQQCRRDPLVLISLSLKVYVGIIDILIMSSCSLPDSGGSFLVIFWMMLWLKSVKSGRGEYIDSGRWRGGVGNCSEHLPTLWPPCTFHLCCCVKFPDLWIPLSQERTQKLTLPA